MWPSVMTCGIQQLSSQFAYEGHRQWQCRESKEHKNEAGHKEEEEAPGEKHTDPFFFFLFGGVYLGIP